MNHKNFYFDHYKMRLIKVSDIDAYYKDAFETADEEAMYYTGSPDGISKEQINAYVHRITEDASRYDFIISKGDEIIGEVVLNNIKDKNSHYRICLFKKENFSKGIGCRATQKILEFAFEDLGLESIELEVYPFNERAIGLYKKLGFEIKEEIIDEEANEPYRKLLVMTCVKKQI